jgi:isopenicillin-N N-acyltransferase like protein
MNKGVGGPQFLNFDKSSELMTGRKSTTAKAKGTFPVLDLVGAPRERGRVHGEELRSLIETGVAQWKEELERARGCSPDTYIAQFLAAMSFDRAIGRWAPDLLEEIRGIAEGAGLPFETVYAYNLLDEEWWFGEEWSARSSVASACSAAGLRVGPTGHPVIAQNMDLPRSFVPTQTVLRVRQENGAEELVLTAAGIIGLCGCNSWGLALCCNALSHLGHSAEGLPVAFVVRRILEQTSIREVRPFVDSVPHASGQNLLLADPDGLCDLECSSNQVAEFGGEAGAIVHANHALANTDVTAADSASDSEARFDFLAARAFDVTTETHLRALLSDRTVPLCKTETSENSRNLTFASLTMEASVPPTVFLAPGPPDRTPWSSLSISDGA